MRTFVNYFFSVLFLVSCSDNPVKKPKNLLDEDTMENVLFDQILLQAMAANAPELLANNSLHVQKYIYQKYKIDSITLLENQNYYAANANKYKHLHKRVLKRIEALQNEKK